MNLFKQRKNKKFSYTPRHQRAFEQNQEEDITSKWKEMKRSSNQKGSSFSRLPIMVLFLIAVLILLYILGRY